MSPPPLASYDAKHPLRSLWRWTDISVPHVIAVYVVFVIKSAPGWLWPFLLFAVVEVLDNIDHYGTDSLWWIGAGMLLALLVNVPGHLLYITLLSRIARRLERRLRSNLVHHLQRLTIGFHNNSASGRLHTKVVRDVEAVENLIQQIGQPGFETSLSILVAVTATAYHKPAILLLYLACVPIFVLLTTVFRRRIQRANQSFRIGVEQVGGRVAEMIDLIPLTRAHGLEQTELTALERHLGALYGHGVSFDKTNGLFQSATFVTMRTCMLLSLMGFAVLVLHDVLSVPELVLYMGIFTQIMWSTMGLMHQYPLFAKGVESIHSIGEILSNPAVEQGDDRPALVVSEAAISFNHISFCYPDRDRNAIDDFTLEVRPGECIALVGESGSGKSTAMSLLIGFFTPDHGSIHIDGQDLSTHDLGSWRRNLAAVPQQTLLFSGSLRDNITYGLTDFSDEHLAEVTAAANLDDLISELPAGIDTQIGENGVQLSGGQRQRVAIARALIRDPKVIILDEATSALDVASERSVQEAIDRLVANRTTFIIAHRLSTIRNANRIVVLSNGRCVEIGSQADLLARDGEFARLKRLQD
ncbi:MAG: ABC transporter ATP-binding protein [Planctomycetota bacterium]